MRKGIRHSVFLTFMVLLPATRLSAQLVRKVLFLGNSYTGVNNLPQLVKDAALSAGDTLVIDSYTPGGYTLEGHSQDPVSQNKIMAGGWDYVVLQGQSQEPVVQFPVFQQGAYALAQMVRQYNACALPMLYMTWGRKNGDAANCLNFPEVCTYTGMDSVLRHRYLYIASHTEGEVSPVSVVWRYLRLHHPGIELYDADGSHPSAAGSYAAACCFYAAIFKKDPTLISFNSSLNATDAAIIRLAAKTEVYDHPDLWDYHELPQSDFYFNIGPGVNEVLFSASGGVGWQTYAWDFGDGFTSALPNPTHSYAANGTYTVTLTTSNCDVDGQYTSTTDTVIQFCSHTPVIYAAHSWLCLYDTLWTQPADAYQWYAGGSPIAATQQYLPDYDQYNSLGFTVLATVNGCAELSQVYSANPVWSGYYFDAAWGGDPCAGDTALFIVLHINGALSGTEIIRWYKDGALLPFYNDQDTLFIISEGNYECRVMDTTSICPMDTTISPLIQFDCQVESIPEVSPLSWSLYPNPAADMIYVQWMSGEEEEPVNVYNMAGQWVKTATLRSPAPLCVADLPPGLYFMRSVRHPQAVLKFIRQ